MVLPVVMSTRRSQADSSGPRFQMTQTKPPAEPRKAPRVAHAMRARCHEPNAKAKSLPGTMAIHSHQITTSSKQKRPSRRQGPPHAPVGSWPSVYAWLAAAVGGLSLLPGGRIASRGLGCGPRLLLADAAASCSKAKSRTRPEHAHMSAAQAFATRSHGSIAPSPCRRLGRFCLLEVVI